MEKFEEQSKQMKLDIDFPAINIMCREIFVQEEKTYIEKIRYTFEKAWNEVSLGENFINEYMKVCQTKQDFSSDFFFSTNRQLRLLIKN